MNFILFFPDEMRASSVSCYGNMTVKMPNFDRLADEGTRFDQCIVQNPVCTPSRCSLMTGWYVHNMGHRSLWHNLRTHEPSLFRYLKQAGYDIAWYGKNDLYSQEYLDEILDDIGEKRGGYKSEPSRPYVKPGRHSKKFEPGEIGYLSFLMNPTPSDGDEFLDVHTARALDFLESRKDDDKPFMLYLPIAMPHPPYCAVERYHTMYKPEEVSGEVIKPGLTTGKPAYEELIRQSRDLDKADESLFDEIRAVYLGMNSCVDAMLGEILDTLDRTGLAENTTVIVCSDHGDWAGDYGLVEKWSNAMDDKLVRVPLIIKSPGHKQSHTVREQVEMFDIMPTVLALAGIEAHHAHFAQSLVPQLDGAAGDPDRAAFCEGGYDRHEKTASEWYSEGSWAKGIRTPGTLYYPKVRLQHDHPDSICRAAMIRTLTHKLTVRSNGENELYDLLNDPDELHNRYDSPDLAVVRTSLEKQMLEWYIKTSDVVPTDYDSRGFHVPVE